MKDNHEKWCYHCHVLRDVSYWEYKKQMILVPLERKRPDKGWLRMQPRANKSNATK
jgi:hypothetical protein